jgi:fused signal recognition particle receptor
MIMLQLLTDFFKNFHQSLLATGRLEEIIGLLLVIILLLLLAVTVRHRKKAERQEKPEHISKETSDKDLQADTEDKDISKEALAEPKAKEPAKETVSQDESGRFFDRLKNGLGKTRKSLGSRLERVFSEKTAIDSQSLEDIEEALITADVGMDTTMELMGRIQSNAAKISGPDELRSFLKQEMEKVFDEIPTADTSDEKPHVIMVVGVNGVGKTTTIGKLAYQYQKKGRKTLMGAADTFRAAAVEQLTIWAQRSGAEIVAHRENADPAAVAFDAVEAGISRGADCIIIDTAGRLHTKVNLMEQLKKIKRSIAKRLPGAPHEVLLVLDATTGQNAISQAKLFHEGIGITGMILTKLDGTAKGGIVVGICNTMKLPLHYIGVGEAMEDLQPFDPKRFIDALF